MLGQCSHDECPQPAKLKCLDCQKDFCETHLHSHAGYSRNSEEYYFSLADKFNQFGPKSYLESMKSKVESTRNDSQQRVNALYNEYNRKLEEKIRSPGRKLRESQLLWEGYENQGKVSHQQLADLQKTIREAEEELGEVFTFKSIADPYIPTLRLPDVSTIKISIMRPPAQNPTIQQSIDLQKNSNSLMNFQAPPAPVGVAPVDPNALPYVVPVNSNPIPYSVPRKSTAAEDLQQSRRSTVTVVDEPSFHFPPDFRIFNCSNRSGVAMASNGKYVLLSESQRLLLLNQDFRIKKTISWPDEAVYDINWVESIKSFLVITDRRSIYVMNPNDLSRFEMLEDIPEQNWWSITSANRYVYLSTYGESPTLSEVDATTAFRVVKQWKTPYICQNNEYIHQIRASEDRIHLLISNATAQSSRCDIRALRTLQLMTYVTLPFKGRSYQATMRCCLLPKNEFLIIYEDFKEVVHVNRNLVQHTVEHKGPIWNGLLINADKLFIRTDKYFYVYTMEFR